MKAERVGIILCISLLLCISLDATRENIDINVATMHRIYSNMDPREHPCQNFWSYACGNWSVNYMDNFQVAEESYAKKMVTVLDDDLPIRLSTSPPLLVQMRNYFTSCVGQRFRKVELPQQLFSSNFDWVRETAKLRKYGLNGVFFDETVGVAYNDSLRYVIQLKMPSDIYFPKASFTSELLEVEKDLSELLLNHRIDEPLFKSLSLQDLKHEIPQIDWQMYFKELFATERIDINVQVEVSDMEYLRALGNLLNSVNKTKLEQYMRERLVDWAREVNTNVAPRAYNCIHHMRAVLPLGMNYIYDRYVYRTRSEDMRQLQHIFTSLRDTFGKYLERNPLELDSDELRYLHSKLAHMRIKLGNLPEEASDDFFAFHYASATFVSSNFYQNLWTALQLRFRLQHMRLMQPRSRVELKHYYVNDDLVKARNAPYFERVRNTVIVPLIFIQWPFFDYRQHAIFRNSLMGFILAHELIHAFEQDGVLFDDAGNESFIGGKIRLNHKFQGAVQCFQRTKTKSLNERIADVTGLQLAYDTFFGIGNDLQQFSHQRFEFQQQFSAPQLFHLNFAQFFCGRLPTAIGHDMDNVRVNNAEKNLHQFSIDFNCRQQFNSAICEMWRSPSTSVS